MVAKMEKEKRISTKQLTEELEKLKNEVQHLRNENKELKTECASNTVSLSRMKIYIDELIATSNENIAMLDKRILTQPIPMASDSAKPPVQKTTITVSRAAEVYKQFKQKQNGN